MKKNYYIIGIFTLLTLVFTFPLILKMRDGLYGSFFNTDLRGSVWFLWWVKKAFMSHLNMGITPYICAPHGQIINFQNFFWISFNTYRWLTVFTSPVFTINVLVLLGFILSGLFMSFLVVRLTKNSYAGLISGIIFAFSPYHLNKVMEFGLAFHGCWLVLYISFLLQLKEKTNFKTIAFSSLALALVTDFNAYYGFFALVLTFGFILFCFLYQWRISYRHVIDPSSRYLFIQNFKRSIIFVAAVVLVLFGYAFIELPSVLSFSKKIFSGTMVTSGGHASEYVRPISYLFAQSARPLSYLLPASTHPIFGAFTKNMFGSIFYGRGSIEQTLYLGWVPLILAYVAFRQWRHKRSQPAQYPDYSASSENFAIGFFIFSAILAFLCSLPPYGNLGLFKIYLPSYLFYKFLPMFRAYARFGILVSLSVAVLAGFGLKYTLERIKTKEKRRFFTGFMVLAILFEFTNMPPLRVADISKVPSVYQWLGEQKGDLIIAEYPMAMVSQGEAWENYDYLFYQTRHQKRLVNGAMAGTEAFEIKNKILKINAPATIMILKKLGVKYVIMHTDLYKEGDYGDAVDVVGEVPRLEPAAGWNLIKTFDTVDVYDIGKDSDVS
jgi:hypothetical protein